MVDALAETARTARACAPLFNGIVPYRLSGVIYQRSLGICGSPEYDLVNNSVGRLEFATLSPVAVRTNRFFRLRAMAESPKCYSPG